MKRVLFAVIVLAIVIAGCEKGNTSTGKTTPFCGGTDGLDIQFVEGSPPTEVFDSNQFPFGVDIRMVNKGESDIVPGAAKIELSGISSVDFGGPSYSKVFNEKITGKRKDQNGLCTEGDAAIMSFGSGEEPFRYKRTLPGNTQFTLRADVCYGYKTTSNVQFCVQNELPRFGQEPTCKVDEAKVASNSGSPIQVENFKQNPGGERKIAFAFEIIHKGPGAVHFGTLCDNSFQNRNRVRVKVSSTVGSISCSSLNGRNEGEVVLSDNKRVMNCVMDTTGLSGREFETPLQIETMFNYKQHKDIPILVKHLG